MALKEQYTTLGTVLRLGPNDSIATREDYAVCRRVMQAASNNYSFASRFLPADKLHHVEALYALMRVGDDRVDVSHQGYDTSLAAIEDWECAYWRAFEQGDSADAVLRAYLNTSIECDIPAETMEAYFRAMKEDLTITRFPTFADLMHYMEGSAIPVGRAMTHILGVRAPWRLEDALPGADSLSIAMQLSNFWRDIGEDWQRTGRVYIPQEDMASFNYTEADLAARRINSKFIELMDFEMERTEKYYVEARRAVRLLASGQWGVMSGLEVYRAILASIRRNQYDVFERRARVHRLRMIALAARAAWLALFLIEP
jgi:phytoene synthase